MDKIAAGLERDGILTGAGGKKWHTSTINRILRNEKYIGDALLHKSPKPLIQSVSDFYFFLTEKPCKSKSSGNRGFKLSLLLPELFCFPGKIIYFYDFQMNPLPRNNLKVWGKI